MPRSTNSRCTKSRASRTASTCGSSRGKATSTSRASCASFLFSPASTAFHKVARSTRCEAAPAGSRISECTTPALLVKSCVRPSRSSCSAEADR